MRAESHFVEERFIGGLTSILLNYVGHDGDSGRLVLHHMPIPVPLNQFDNLPHLRLCSPQPPLRKLHIFLCIGQLAVRPGVEGTGCLFYLVGLRD